MTATHPLRLVVLCPHFDPDTAPTGRVMTRIVEELAARGHQVHVVTALPWYRSHAIEPGWHARVARRGRTSWGTITRVNPFPGGDKRNLLRRALGFAGFSALAGLAGLGAGGWFRRADAVIAMSPPLTMGLTGRLVGWAHRCPLVFNIQDVFPDAAVETGAITNRRVIALASWLERLSYRAADAITVLSDDLADNVRAKLPASRATTVHMIPNFVDTDRIRPSGRLTPYRQRARHRRRAGRALRRQRRVLAIARPRARRGRELPEVTFLINGEGSMRVRARTACRRARQRALRRLRA